MTNNKDALGTPDLHHPMYQKFYDFLPIGYITLDGEGIIKWVNNWAAQVLDDGIDVIINNNFINYIHRKDQILFPVNKSHFSDHDQHSFDVRLKNRQGFFWVRIHICIDEQFYHQDRRIKLIFYDISDLKQYCQDADELKHQLRLAQKMEAIGVLSSGIVHDFNNILNPIIWNLEMLIKDKASGQKLKKDLNSILAGASRARDLAGQILNFSHKADNEISPTQMKPIIKEVLKLTRAAMPANITICQDIDNQCGSVMAVPAHIHQVVMNLITNAFYAMGDEGGILDVSLKEVKVTRNSPKELILCPGVFACLSVSDTGEGMDASIINNIFNPYFTTKKDGTGLGLPVILNIVKDYGGDISFSSKPGKGSRFQAYIPIMNNMSDTTKNSNKTDISLDGNESILLIDDEPFIIDVQQERFERRGYTVKSFENSFDALNEFKARPDSFDIVMCDMTMPGMTGLVLAKKLKQIRSDIKIIIFTGFSQHINKNTYHSLGIDGFLMKPFKKDESLKLVRHILDSR